MIDERVHWAHLAAVEGVGSAIFDQLQKRFGSIRRAMEAPLDEVLDIPGLDERTAEAVCRARQTLDATRAKIEEITKQGVRVITKMDSDYPPRFRQAVNPPPLLYQIGEWRPQDDRAVAVIGSRDCSDISAKRAREYAQFFAASGLTVVSGYASGVDTSGHIGALEGGGRTVIIPGCGVEVFDLDPLKPVGVTSRQELAKHAVIITEQPPDADWSARASLARNRLVAAQASAVLVIEARLHSSTLDTVSRAQKLGRPIFTQVFATVTERVMGNEMLRKEGAGEIHDANDLQKIVDLVKGLSSNRDSSVSDDDLRR